MSILIKFKRKKSENDSLAIALDQNGDLNGLEVKSGEPIDFQLNNGDKYLILGNAADSTTLSSDKCFIKARTKDTVDKGVYFETDSSKTKGLKNDSGDSIKIPLISNVDGILPIANGGTGFSSEPSMRVNLSSPNAVSPFQASPRPGVEGTLPTSRGGTGRSKDNVPIKDIAYSGVYNTTIRITNTSSPTVNGQEYRYTNLSYTITGYNGTGSITNKTKIDLQPNKTVLDEMMDKGLSSLYVENNNSTITLISYGAAWMSTTIEIPCTLYEVEN